MTINILIIQCYKTAVYFLNYSIIGSSISWFILGIKISQAAEVKKYEPIICLDSHFRLQ